MLLSFEAIELQFFMRFLASEKLQKSEETKKPFLPLITLCIFFIQKQCLHFANDGVKRLVTLWLKPLLIFAKLMIDETRLDWITDKLQL